MFTSLRPSSVGPRTQEAGELPRLASLPDFGPISDRINQCHELKNLVEQVAAYPLKQVETYPVCLRFFEEPGIFSQQYPWTLF